MIYVHSVYHKIYKKPVNLSIEEIIKQAAREIDCNTACPVQIEDDDGNVLMEQEELLDKAYDLLEKQ